MLEISFLKKGAEIKFVKWFLTPRIFEPLISNVKYQISILIHVRSNFWKFTFGNEVLQIGKYSKFDCKVNTYFLIEQFATGFVAFTKGNFELVLRLESPTYRNYDFDFIYFQTKLTSVSFHIIT